MLLRWVSMCVWALVAASAVLWGLRLFTKPTPVPPHVQVADAAAARGDLGRVLGVDVVPQAAPAPAPTADARFSLVGVVSPRSGAGGVGGVALIAVDGKPAKAYRLGAVVEGQHVLQSISARGAGLGPKGGPTLVALIIPPPAPAATGQLQPPAGQAANPLPTNPLPATRLPPMTTPPVMPPQAMPAPQDLSPQPPPQLQQGVAGRPALK